MTRNASHSGAASGPLPSPGTPLSRRWLLAGTLLLVALLLGALMFLAAKYEQGREQAALEHDADLLVNDLRSALFRNVQTLHSLPGETAGATAWAAPAAELLRTHRELVRLELRDSAQVLTTYRETPYLAPFAGPLRREPASLDLRQVCEYARRRAGPAFSASYFLPLGGGHGMELMEMCLPLLRAGAPSGYLVATYALPGLLSELSSPGLLRGRRLTFIEADGTRLALYGALAGQQRTLQAVALLDLPGHTLMLRLESPPPGRAGPYGLFPNLLSAVVGLLSLALLAVLALLGRDMRLRQRAELEVADALAFRKAMENSLVTGLRARSMDGRVTYVNPAFCQMVGLSAEQLIGTGLPAPWWPPELIDEYQQRQAVRLAGQTMSREGYESVFQRSDGTRFPVLIIEAPLIDAQGVQTGFMSAILDLTEQRRIEEQNRTSQDRLQATARLATVGEMASLLSHELNQPLAAIASYASGTLNLLRNPAGELPQAELQQAMQRISEQADRAGRVIKSVTDFVRRREQVREAVAPQHLLDAIAPLIRLQAKKLGIRVRMDLAADLPAVLCDRTMVEQVLLNLARNGMQAMCEGDPPARSGLRLLTLAARRAPAPTGGAMQKTWIEFSVTDHGQGLSADVQNKLFTPFFTTRAEGLGLGLNLCRTVIEQHGGVLGFAPAHPRGTVFRFSLPQVERDAPVPAG